MPEPIDECVESLLEDNPEMDEGTAHAICNDMQNRGVLEDWIKNGPNHALCYRELADQPPSQIERKQLDNGSVRWEGVMLLSPGIWRDGASGEAIYYSPEGIKASKDRWQEDTLNFLHASEDETWHVGRVDQDSVRVDDEGRLYADLVLPMDTNASKLADEALQKSFETSGEEGVKGPSVEIIGDEYRYNHEHGVRELAKGTFLGAGLVGVGMTPGPAAKTTSFRQQVQERAIAMQNDSPEDPGGVRLLRLMKDMAANKNQQGGSPMQDVQKEALKLAKRFLQEGNLTKQEVADIVAETWEELDAASVLDILEDVTEDEDEEGEPPEGSEEDLQDDEDDDEDEEEAEMSLQDLADHIDEQITSLQSNVEERLTEFEEKHDLSNLEDRLENLEDLPKGTKLLHDDADDDTPDLEGTRYLRDRGTDRTTSAQPVQP